MRTPITIIFLLLIQTTFGQKKLNLKTTEFNLDTNIIIESHQMPFSYLFHYDQEVSKDRKTIKKFGKLLEETPNEKNYDNYYELACAYWNLSDNDNAENLFLKILNSNETHYNKTELNNSDIPYDTTTNIYGYGSYTFSYKNKACLYLCKINLERKNYEEALKYIELADKKYKTSYSCGTGYRRQLDEYNFLYATCYEGLGKYNQVLDLLMPEVLNRNDEISVNAIKKLYSQKEIENEISKGEKEIKVEIDKEPNYSYTSWTDPKTKKEITDSAIYFPATAKITLFSYEIEMTNNDLNHIKKINNEIFVADFRKTDFYRNLMKQTK